MAKSLLSIVTFFFLSLFVNPSLSVAIPLAADDKPQLKLPWGIYEATKYDSNGQFYIFQNVRFGKAPNGTLRFKKSEFPDPVATPVVLPSDQGSACYAANPPPCPSSKAPVADSTVPDAPPGALLPRQPNEPSEDCLFADLYVPASAIRKPSKLLPVVVWLYGGAFVFDAKDSPDALPFYDGTGLLTSARKKGNDVIFVTGNYRLGAFGWLAGADFTQSGGVSNAGLWDQRLLIQFVSEHIGKLGGDASKISLWGESAGAGSIMHHLISTEPPLFSRVVMQSPAYLWQWDQSSSGYGSRMYNELAQKSGCDPSHHSDEEIFACLQNTNPDALQKANAAIVSSEWLESGLSPFGPAIDGSLIKHLPPVALALKQGWSNATSFLISHVHDESRLFIPCYCTSNDGFATFLKAFFGSDGYATQKTAITQKYVGITNERAKVQAIIRDSSFICNNRFVYDAYASDQSKSLYMMQYDFLSSVPGGYDTAIHGADLLPTYYSKTMNRTAVEYFLMKRAGISQTTASVFMHEIAGLATDYQNYLTSFAATGVPKGPLTWNKATVKGDSLNNVMETAWTPNPFGADFNFPTVDTQVSQVTCDFWRKLTLSLEGNPTQPSANEPELLLQDGTIKVDL